MKHEYPITIADLYPELSREQQEEAGANLRQYLAVLLRMTERLECEGKSINDLPVDCSFDSDADQRYHPNAQRSISSK
jgi:hypothetical protein